MKALQIFTKEYLEWSSKLTVQEKLDWLNDFQLTLPDSVYTDRVEEIHKKWESNNR